MRAWWLLFAIGCGGGGDSGNCPPFATIVDGSFARVGTQLTWLLEVESMPAQLDFDREGIPNFFLEYGWTVEIDADNDGTHELEVSATHFKLEGPPRTAPPLDVLQVEPAKPDNPLLKMPHVILSPHNASASARFDAGRRRRVGQELALVLSGRWPMSCVNPTVLPQSGARRSPSSQTERGIDQTGMV
jgi:hypothetical protein